MPQCQKCRAFLPPGFIHTEHPRSGEPLKGALCLFCIEEKNTIIYDNGRKKVNKSDIVYEYDIFMKRIKEDNQILKDGAQGKFVKGMEKFAI